MLTGRCRRTLSSRPVEMQSIFHSYYQGRVVMLDHCGLLCVECFITMYHTKNGRDSMLRALLSRYVAVIVATLVKYQDRATL